MDSERSQPEASNSTELDLAAAVDIIGRSIAAAIVDEIERRGIGIYPDDRQRSRLPRPAFPVIPAPMIDHALRERPRGWFEEVDTKDAER